MIKPIQTENLTRHKVFCDKTYKDKMTEVTKHRIKDITYNVKYTKNDIRSKLAILKTCKFCGYLELFVRKNLKGHKDTTYNVTEHRK